jgi:hypothetical protein
MANQKAGDGGLSIEHLQTGDKVIDQSKNLVKAFRKPGQEDQQVGQYYIRPDSFYEPFNSDEGDGPDSRYAKISTTYCKFLNPLDYEREDEFIARLCRVHKVQDPSEYEVAVFSEVFEDWATDDSNWPFLRHEEKLSINAYAHKWPIHIVEIMNSPTRLLDDDGHFIPLSKWLGRRPPRSIRDCPIRYGFARWIARRDPRVLPYEKRAEYLERQKNECTSCESDQTLSQSYDAWANDPENLELLPATLWSETDEIRDSDLARYKREDNRRRYARRTARGTES